MLTPLAMAISCRAASSIMPVLVLRLRRRFVFGSSEDAVPTGVKVAG